MKLKTRQLILLIFPLIFTSCYSSCDCFDEPDYAFGFSIDIKKHNPSMSVEEFLRLRDTTGNPANYTIKVIGNDSSVILDHFDWHGNGKGDTLIYYTIWNPTNPRFPIKQIEFEIPSLKIRHKISDFIVEGRFSRGQCSCFTPTRKEMTLDDSAVIDQLRNGLLF